MKDINIKRHNFNKALKRLSSFIAEYEELPGLDTVETESFIIFEHRVTGEEFNNLVEQVLWHLNNIYDQHVKYVEELHDVYTALNALDKDYIEAILIEMKLSKKVNEKVQKAQDDIKKTITTQNKIIGVLQKHKERLDKYEHLADIDKIYQDNQAQRDAIISLEKSVKEQEKSIDALNEFKELLNAMEHLQDIDLIWDEVTKNNNQISGMKETIDILISKLTCQSEQVSSPKEYNEKICNQEKVHSEFETSEKNLLNKIKIAQILAGGSIGLVIIEFILIILRLI